MRDNSSNKPQSTRDSYIFYRSFFDAISEAPQEEQLKLYQAIALFALDGIEPQLEGLTRALWLVIRPQLEANWRRYENGRKGARYGNRGGAPKGNNNASKQPQNNPKTTPKQPQNNPKTTPKQPLM